MSFPQRQLVDQILRDGPFDLGGSVDVQRPILDQMLTSQPLSDDVRVRDGQLGGVPVVFVDIDGAEPRGVIFHIHGGGFALGSASGSIGLLSSLARRTKMRAVSVDYRLAPEHTYPAAHDDVASAYRGLIARLGADERVVVSGESAGGNLALELLIDIVADGGAAPSAAVLFSPMTDLTVSGSTFVTKAELDPNITAEAIRTRATEYLAGADPSDPKVSPLFADLAGLPPLLIQAGSNEVLLEDATRLAAKAAGDNVAVTLDVVPGVPHVFQAFEGILDEGRSAMDRVALFIGDNT